ncbi:MAG: sodium/proline symporter PutP [Clostridia bacterium]|nr:sodium/proline symporter PutP [Clostridia bacterium]
MTSQQIQILIAMVIYMAAVIFIGVYFSKKANKSSDDYFLGGRTLGPWVTAMSAEASDMSGWLLMGLPGVAYATGLADAFWTAFGLAIGTYVNWLIVSKRLRRYSVRANNSVTLPDFFSNRFREKQPVIMTIASLFILVFFTVYAASCFVTCGKLFSQLFGLPYVTMMIVGAVFVLAYTLLGGFLAESASDFMQAIVMIIALIVMVIIGVAAAGGFGAVIDNAKSMPGYLELFQIHKEGAARPYGFLNVVSMLAWGLGYFGMPQVLLRFMAIRKESELRRSRIIATVWVIISLAVAVFIGIVGNALNNIGAINMDGTSSENVFIVMTTSLIPALLAGFIMAGILAATISSSDSYLLIAASAFAKNIFKGIFKKSASDKQVMWASRIVLLIIAVIAMLFALDEDSVIFQIVSFAWAGFGATFGPLMLFSLFWKRTTKEGAIAGMIAGAGMVFLWKLVISTLGGGWAIYELLPAFIFSSVVIVVVSLLTKKPSDEILEDFESVKNGKGLEQE